MGVFDGKVALVTGGTSGIGRAAAVAFGREGASVVVAGRSIEGGQETVRQIAAAGGEAVFVRTDVSKEADVKALVDQTIASYGRLDAAFNNAGVEQKITPLHELTEDAFDHIMNTNVKGVFFSLKYEALAMLKTGGGAIVNNSSVAGVVSVPGVAAYAASKHAVIGLTKSAALDYAKLGIRVNAVCPGVVETPMVERIIGGDKQIGEFLHSLHPIGRTGRPEEIADVVVWLCSPRSSFVTGISVCADGGFTAQ